MRSKLEERLAEGPLKNLKYEPFTVEYESLNDYTPDFVGEDENIWYEVKGRPRTFQEVKKYIFIKECWPKVRLRFILSNPNVRAYPQAKKLTLGEWCTKHGFEWCDAENIPEEWRY